MINDTKLLKLLERDFDREHWYRLDLWSPIEAIALFLDKDPIVFRKLRIIHLESNLPIIDEAKKFYNILMRYLDNNSKSTFFKEEERIKSLLWIEIAVKKHLSMPEDMYDEVCKYNQYDNANWEEKYNILMQENADLTKKLDHFQEKPLQHGKEKSLKKMIAMFLVLYYEKAYGKNVDMAKMGSSISATNLHQNIFSTIDFTKYNNFKPIERDAFTDHFKSVREMLGFTPTECNKNNLKNK